MSRRKLFIVPDGGLGNRLRALASGIFLARHADCEPIVIWHPDNLCRINLADIIQLSALPAKVIQPSEPEFHAFFEIPRRRNFYMPRLLAPLRFRNRFYDNLNLRPYCDDCPALLRRLTGSKGNCLFFSGQEFYDFPRDFFREIIKPTEAVKARAMEILDGRKPEIAIQIRRTDHQTAISASPLEKFIEIINLTAPKSFFLATDSQEIKTKILKDYPERATTNPSEANRGSLAGLIDAMAEIYILSLTKRIYASFGSSFPTVASWLGDVELIWVKV